MQFLNTVTPVWFANAAVKQTTGAAILPWWFWLAAALIIIALILLCIFVKPFAAFALWILKGAWWLVRHLAIALWWIISAPFRLIIWAVKRHKKNKEENGDDPKPRKQDKTGRIYKTTDGYLSGRSDIKKPRNIAAIEQRADDGALAVVKIYSLNGKEKKSKKGKNYIPDLVLSPKEHAALKEDSIVGRQVIVGIKQGNGNPPKSILPRELQATNDKLTKKELKKIQAEVHNDTPEHRETFKEKMKSWRNHFKGKKKK